MAWISLMLLQAILNGCLLRDKKRSKSLNFGLQNTMRDLSKQATELASEKQIKMIGDKRISVYPNKLCQQLQIMLLPLD